jgi:hypothetical protein
MKFLFLQQPEPDSSLERTRFRASFSLLRYPFTNESLFSSLGIGAMGLADEPQKPLGPPSELSDPRAHVFGYASEIIRAGVERDSYQYPWKAIIIIHWMPAPNGKVDTYQIGGIPGYHSKERVEAFLKAFYSKAAFPNAGPEVPNVVLCGNNWGAGQEISRFLVDYSKAFGFSAFSVGGWAFWTVKLIDEPEPRKTAIKRAFDASEPPATPK